MSETHFADDTLRNHVADYKLQLLAPNQLSATDFDKFHSSLRQVMGFIKYSTDKEKLKQLMLDDTCNTFDEMAAMVINHCTDVDIQLEQIKEETNMNSAWNELKEDYRNEGENIRAEKVAKNMLQLKKLSYEDIAECSELSLDKVKELAEQINAIAV